MRLFPVRSLRASLLFGTIGTLVFVLAAAGIALDRGVRWSLIEQIDRELQGKAVLLASTVEVTRTGLDVAFNDLDMREFETGDDPLLLALTLLDGTEVYRSPSVVDYEIEPRDTAGALEARTLDLRTRRLRAVELAFKPSVDLSDDDDAVDPADSLAVIAPPTLHLFLARDTVSVESWIRRLRLVLLLVGAAAALLATILLGAAIRGSLRPLDRLADRIAELDASSLSARVPPAEVPEELVPVVDRLNGLLEQLEAAFERERTFSADIAHELRTPLAGLRTTLEVELGQTRSPQEYRESLDSVLQIVQHMQRLVHALLDLARLESGDVSIEHEIVPVDATLRMIWGPLEEDARRRGLSVTWTVDPASEVSVDPALFESAMRNLLHNAVAHADEGGRVTVSSAPSSSRRVRVRIANTGSTIAPEQIPQLLDRFSRTDASRSTAKGHFGLGLAIVHRIAQVLAAPFEVRSSSDGEFEVEMEFPLVMTAPAKNSAGTASVLE